MIDQPREGRFGSDALYELTQVTQGTNTTEPYSYGPVGNRTASLGVPSYTTNSSNEMTANSNATYTYDSNGNTLTKTDSTGTTTYAWDFENRLTGVTLPGSGGTVTFKYDPFDRRIEKVSPAMTTIFAYDADNLMETTNGSGMEVASYTQGPRMDEPLAMLRGVAANYYEQDGLGSVTSLTNSSGSLAQTYAYDSFGNTTASSGSLTNFFRYASREFDTETDLYFYRARYYDPSSGKFSSEDPIGFDAGNNFYAYVQNEPTNAVDPFGLQPPGLWRSLLTWGEGVSDAGGMTLGWATGIGPSSYDFGPGSVEVNNMMHAPGTDAARHFFYCKNGGWRTQSKFKDEHQHRIAAKAHCGPEGAVPFAVFAKGTGFPPRRHVLHSQAGFGAHNPFSPLQ